MLARLGRWLRAAGYDTAISGSGQSDRELIALCRREGRILVTKDRQLAAAASAEVETVLLTRDGVGAEAEQLGLAMRIDWLRAPFTRCLVDNTPLDDATAEDVARTPDKAQALGGSMHVCPLCGRLYWPGSHVRRMTARLQRFCG